MIRPLAWLTLLAALAASGCGYRQGGEESSSGYRWRSLYRQNIKTVAVPIFTSKDFHRGVELTLSSAVAHQLEAQTPYKIVPRQRADTILEGEIVSSRVITLSNDPATGQPQEQLLTLSINFIWKDLRSGQILVQRKNFDQSNTYFPTLGEARFVGDQQTAEKLALAIVRELQADW